MRCPTLNELPPPPPGKTGWPWTEESPQLPNTMPDGRPWPRVSIVMPSYNQGQFIEESIRSVLLQGYPDLEYIIIDGCSTDGSVDIIRKYEPWLAYWLSETDQGQSHAINKGWQRATGEAITWLNSDDTLEPCAISRSVRYLFADEETDLVYGDARYIDQSSQPTGKLKQGRDLDMHELICRWRNPIPQQGFLMRRRVLERVGWLDENLHFAMDFDYWIRLALSGARVRYMGKVLASFRRHSAAKSSTQRFTLIEDCHRIFEKVYTDPSRPESIRRMSRDAQKHLDLRAARIAYGGGDARRVRRYAYGHIQSSGFRPSLRGAALFLVSFLGDRGMIQARAWWKTIKKLTIGFGETARRMIKH